MQAPHAERPGLRRQVLGQELDAGLGRGVGDRRARVGPAGGGRGHGDDAPAPACLHGGQDAADGEERRGEVHVDRCPPRLLGDLLDRPRWDGAAAGVGHQDVDRPDPLLDLRVQALDLGGVREVGDDRDGTTAVRARSGRGRPRPPRRHDRARRRALPPARTVWRWPHRCHASCRSPARPGPAGCGPWCPPAVMTHRLRAPGAPAAPAAPRRVQRPPCPDREVPEAEVDGRHPPVRLVDEHERGAEGSVDGPTLVRTFLLLRADHDGGATEAPDVRVRGEREAAGLEVAQRYRSIHCSRSSRNPNGPMPRNSGCSSESSASASPDRSCSPTPARCRGERSWPSSLFYDRMNDLYPNVSQ